MDSKTLEQMISRRPDGKLVMSRMINPADTLVWYFLQCFPAKSKDNQGLYINRTTCGEMTDIFYWCLITNTVKLVCKVRSEFFSIVMNETPDNLIVGLVHHKDEDDFIEVVSYNHGSEVIVIPSHNVAEYEMFSVDGYVVVLTKNYNEPMRVRKIKDNSVFEDFYLSTMTRHHTSVTITTLNGERVLVFENHDHALELNFYSLKDGEFIYSYKDFSEHRTFQLLKYSSTDDGYITAIVDNETIACIRLYDDRTINVEEETSLKNLGFGSSCIVYYEPGMKITSTPDHFIIHENYNHFVDTKPAKLIYM